MGATLTSTELAARHHRRAVHFFWAWLLGATLVKPGGQHHARFAERAGGVAMVGGSGRGRPAHGSSCAPCTASPSSPRRTPPG